MRKFIALSMIGLFSLGTLQSCDDRIDDNEQFIDNDTYAVMKDVTGNLTAANDYSIKQNITVPNTDVVLVYRNVNSNTSNGTVWQLLPKTEYLASGREIDYNFLFNTSLVEIYAESSLPLNTNPYTQAEINQYMTNQTFRIVLVPASAGKMANANFEDYNWVVKTFNLKEPK